MTVDMCVTCGGAYFDQGELAVLARKHAEQLGELDSLVAPKTPAAKADDGGEALRCPGCATPMQSYDYAQCSGIRLARCPQCGGTWVDDGELQAIEAHIEKGHKLLARSADTMGAALGVVPEALPDTSQDRWSAIGAIAGVLGHHILTA
jgi:Zn-finger nucleic acid-binding protein